MNDNESLLIVLSHYSLNMHNYNTFS